MRGKVGERPWAVVLAAFARNKSTGQLTVCAADQKRYAVAFDAGEIVAASSPLAPDSVARVALTSHFASPKQISELARRLVTLPGLDEVAEIAEIANLSAEQVMRLQNDLIARRTARTFAIESGTYMFQDRITLPLCNGRVDIRPIVYRGIRMHVSESRLAHELRPLGSARIVLAGSANDEQLARYGFCDGEAPVLESLRDGATFAELEARHRDLDARTLQAAVYALLICGSAIAHRAAPSRDQLLVARTSTTPPSAARTMTAPPAVARTMTAPPAVARTMTPPPAVARTLTPPPAVARTLTAPASVAQTLTAPAVARTLTPPPAVARTLTPPPAVARTLTPPPAVARTIMIPPAVARTLTPPPAVARVSTAQPPAPRTITAQPATPRTTTEQPAVARLASGSHAAIVPRTGSELAADAAERGERALRAHKPHDAILDLEQACRLAADDGDYSGMLAWARFCAADNKREIADKCRRQLDRAIATARRPVQLRVYLGRMERMLGHDREALGHFQAVLELEPKHTDARAEIRVLERRL